MINTVKYLQEALARFNPDARLTYELEVDGISPATECTVKSNQGDDDIADLTKEVEYGEEHIAKLEDNIAELEKEAEEKDEKINELEDKITDLREEIAKLSTELENKS